MAEPDEVEVLIIGGGINGCGTFRDLSAQGVGCLLLEKTDFCAGASAASSRLMHGGLKYLETGEFRLVRESVEERNRLLRNAPHYVKPLKAVLPLRSHLGGIWPSIRRFFGQKATIDDRGTFITLAGLTVYDAFSRRINALPGFKHLSRRKLDERIRGMDEGVRGGALYYEGQIGHAERLGLELVLDGESTNPASKALNHVEVTGMKDGIVFYTHRGIEHAVRPKVIVNAGGAWIDAVNAVLGRPTRLMGGSKGAHLVVENADLFAALNGHMIYFGTADGRVNLVYPFEGRVLVGSTDIKIEDPDEAICSDEEANYLRGVVTEILPDIRITDDQILYRFSGVRPLPRTDGEIGLVTRDHSIFEDALDNGTPVLCLIGGKWTTFRKFSEEAADRILKRFGRTRRMSTEDMAIGGGRNFPAGQERKDWVASCAARNGLSPARIEVLLDRYGTHAETIAERLPKPETPLASLPDYSREEIEFLVAEERVGTLEDLLRRRTTITMSGRATPEVELELARLTGLAASSEVKSLIDEQMY